MSTLIRSACLQGYVPLARSAGLDPYQLLEAVGIHRAWIDQPDTKFSITAFRQLIERSVEASGWPDFGLRLAATRHLSGLGPLALLVREQPTVREAVDTMARHIRLHSESLLLHTENAGDHTLLLLGAAASSRRPSNPMVELTIGALHRAIGQLLPECVHPSAASFMHAGPADASRYQRFFDAPVRFESEFDGLIYPRATMERPRGADPMLERYARQMVAQLPLSHGALLSDHVKALILSSLAQGHCSLQHICDLLGVNERTARRRLRLEGTSYEQILGQVREDLAVRYVGVHQRSLSEVAVLLGFSGGSRFAHWFQQRFGCSATQWRAGARPEPGRRVLPES